MKVNFVGPIRRLTAEEYKPLVVAVDAFIEKAVANALVWEASSDAAASFGKKLLRKGRRHRTGHRTGARMTAQD